MSRSLSPEATLSREDICLNTLQQHKLFLSFIIRNKCLRHKAVKKTTNKIYSDEEDTKEERKEKERSATLNINSIGHFGEIKDTDDHESKRETASPHLVEFKFRNLNLD